MKLLQSFAVLSGVLLFVGASAGCGQNSGKNWYVGEGDFDPREGTVTFPIEDFRDHPTYRAAVEARGSVESIPAESRRDYCGFNVPQADRLETQEVLDQLEGDWRVARVRPRGLVARFSDSIGDFLRPFLSLNQEQRYVSGQYLFSDSFVYRRACVSRPLGPEFGPFEGFRVVEFFANHNAGHAAALIKLGQRIRKRPAILMTEIDYHRYGGDQRTLRNPLELTLSKSSIESSFSNIYVLRYNGQFVASDEELEEASE